MRIAGRPSVDDCLFVMRLSAAIKFNPVNCIPILTARAANLYCLAPAVKTQVCPTSMPVKRQ